MISLREAAKRGQSKFGWLDSRHSFSFGGYHDPRYMGLGLLRVINDDRVAPGAGFEAHPHRDMEIVSYVVDGATEHRDSPELNGTALREGDGAALEDEPQLDLRTAQGVELQLLDMAVGPPARGERPARGAELS